MSRRSTLSEESQQVDAKSDPDRPSNEDAVISLLAEPIAEIDANCEYPDQDGDRAEYVPRIIRHGIIHLACPG